ncbi:MAG: hypothetical protein ACREAU_00635 [Nitrosopumilaceae archaeon]
MRKLKFLTSFLFALYIFIFSNIVSSKELFNYADDVGLMEELSGAEIIAGLNHKKRTLIIFTPARNEKICEIILKHPKVKLLHIYSNKLKSIDCKQDLKNSI